MKIFNIIAIFAVALLSLAAGAAKLMKVPQEAAFFEAVSLAPIFMTIFGALQVLCSVLICIPKTRRIGAGLAALSFFASVVMILKTGQIYFALFSVLPVFLALYVFAFSKQ